MSDLISDEQLVETFANLGVDRESAAHFRGRLQRRLLIMRCTACGHLHHPPRPVCPRCWSTELEATEVSGTGTIHLLIFLHEGRAADEVDRSTPYPVATVELDDQQGLRFTATVIGSPNDEITIGKRVELDWIERGGVPVPAFRLVTEGGS